MNNFFGKNEKKKILKKYFQEKEQLTSNKRFNRKTGAKMFNKKKKRKTKPNTAWYCCNV